MTTHEIIKATVAAEGDVFLTIRWGNAGHQTTERMSIEAAKALGWKRPDPQPVDPAWMVEVAREANAAGYDAANATAAAAAARTGERDHDIGATTAIRALRLALSRGHVVLAPVMPSEEEMLKGAREDAAQVNDGRYPDTAASMRAGDADGNDEVKLALQARRNVYASLGAVAGKVVSSGPVVPEVDLRALATSAWNAGWRSVEYALEAIRYGGTSRSQDDARSDDVSRLLSSLPTREA